ncbi:MAG: efflux RND transporter periplasmic adaptor subunit [Candidatus Pacebacteria bacterium]|nr:efflux RND transporter periplasmic adaptor subunit [Candidatus Paceibacterota bacterium]
MKKRTKIIWVLVVIIIVSLLAWFFVFSKKDNLTYSSIITKTADLTQTVSEVGTIKSVKGVDLNFNQSGKVSRILVKVGEEVRSGQVMAELDSSNLVIRSSEAKSALNVALANLNKLLSGASRSEIAVAEARVKQAENAYLSAINNLETLKRSNEEDVSQAQIKLYELNDASVSTVTSYEQAVKTAEINLTNTKKTYQQAIDDYSDLAFNSVNYQLSVAGAALDDVYTILDDSDAEPYLSAQNSSYLISTNNLYTQSQELLTQAQSDYSQALASQDKDLILNSLSSTLELLNTVFLTLSSCYNALDNSVTSSTFSQASLDAYVANIISQRNLINTGISSIQSARQNLNSAYLSYQTNVSSAENSLNQAKINLSEAKTNAQNTLNLVTLNSEKTEASAIAQVEANKEAWQVAKSELEKLKSPARSEDIELARAQLSQAQSALDLVNKQIEDNIIKAPISGQVAKIDYEVGEQISLSKPIFSLLTANDFEIEVDISEADINKVRVGNEVEITFDAFSQEEKFSAVIAFINPAETIIQEVIYYQVKIQLLDSNSPYFKNIKPGMTANADIITAKLKDVIAIPARAVIDKNGEGKFVRIMENGEIKEVKVETGLRGDDGLIEIKSGLEPGLEVVTYIDSQ